MFHRRVRATLAGFVAAGCAGGVVLTGGSAPVATAAGPRPAAPGAATAVTLVTGDVVTLGGPDGVDVVAARGREHVGFRVHTDVDGDVHVVPDDAASLVSAGRLDPRLFDVTELAASGYGDRDRADLPLIVDYPGATPRSAGARAVRELPALSAVAMNADKGPRFWASARTAATRIWLDGTVRADLDRSVAQIGAPAAWAAGHTGAGTSVAVLDTGIDTTHPDLDDAVAGAADFTGSAHGTDDRSGHGTHVASTITGDGDRYRGVAPDAKLLNGKVISDSGFGQESWVVAGMEWAAARGADVVNMSLGSGWASDGTDPVSLALDRLTAETGTLFVVAAGNSGPDPRSIGSPGVADAALTVGAVDREDRLAGFSSRGPRTGDGAIKPDITAPGVDIVAAKAVNGHEGTPAGDGHVSMSGTSMAAPHVAGAAAILAGLHPDWRPERLKSTLMSTSRPSPGLTAFEQGAGRVDVAAATTATVSADVASLSLGTALWPHHDDQPITRTVTYTNSGTAPVVLDLAAEMTGPDREPAPDGMFTVSPAQVTVPAGGTARATLTADTRVEGADGVYSGAVVATHGDTTVRTATAVDREVESYDLTLTFLDHHGEPTPEYWFRFVDPSNPRAYQGWDPSGEVVVRVPRGRYFLDGWVQTDGGEKGWLTTDFTEPAVVVDGPDRITFDARDGVGLGFTVDRPEAAYGATTISYLMDTAYGPTGSIRMGPDFDGLSTRPSRTSAPGAFTFGMSAQLARPDGTGTAPGFHASPYLYNLRHDDDSGGVPADLTRQVDVRALATVVSTHALATPGTIGVRDDFLTMPLPYTLTEYYTPDTGWILDFFEATSWDEYPTSGHASSVVTPRSYRPGSRTVERWNTGVFGPGFALDTVENSGFHIANAGQFTRQGDRLTARISLYGDQNTDVDGTFPTAQGTTQLVRDGEVVAQARYPGQLEADLPAAEAEYTARATVTKPGPLSTRIAAEWRFRSGHTDEGAPAPIPALAVRFAPALDDHNAARAGTRFSFPVHVQRNGAREPGRVHTPRVEISYDDGKTWQPVRLSERRGRWHAVVDHPAGAAFASLRWSVSDAQGNHAKATIIHAYALTK